jgi:ABC-type phosphate transport system substrate-binding protein
MNNIQVISRPSESTTLKGLKEIVMKGEKMAGSAIIASSAQELSVEVADNPCAIGFVSLKDISNNVKVIKIDGIEMNKYTILTERYPITRAFYYVIYDKPGLEAQNTESNIFDKAAGFFADDAANSLQAKREAIFKFLEFVQSPQGQKILEDNGAVAVY